MNYEKNIIHTCELMAAKLLIILLCVTSVLIPLNLADSEKPGIVINEIENPIKFTHEPSDVTISPGEEASFSCYAVIKKNDFVEIYEWRFNNIIIKTVTLDRNSYKRKKDKVTIRRSEPGTYQCVVNTTYGALYSRTAVLRIAEISVDATKKTNVAGFLSDNVRLECGVHSVPEANVTWRFENAPIQENNKYVISSKYLYINNVSKSDAGQYSCHATNSVSKESVVTKTTLTINESKSHHQLRFISPDLPKRIVIPVNDEVTLPCHVSKSNSEVTWLLVPRQTVSGRVESIPGYTGKGFYNLKTGIMKNYYEGQLQCIVDKGMMQQSVNITFGEAPKITGIIPSRLFVLIGIPVLFECNVTGRPAPKVKWFHNGKLIESDARYQTKETHLRILVSILEDKGIYQCVAENELGSVSRATVLDIQIQGAIPPKVTDVKCTPINSTDIHITFNYTEFNGELIHVQDGSNAGGDEPATDGGTEVAPGVSQQNQTFAQVFSVNYHRTDDTNDKNTIFSPNGSLVVSSLKPNSNYSFSVVRFSGNQGSPLSNWVTCATKVNPTSSTKVNYVWLFADTVLIDWNPNGGVYFHVEARNVLNDSDVISDNTTDNFMVITDLTEDAQYEVYIQSDLKGSPYETLSIAVKSVDQKSKLHFYRINQSSVVITWRLLDTSDLLKGFRLKYRKNDLISPHKETRLFSNETSYIVYDWSPGSQYEVTLMLMIYDKPIAVGTTMYTMEYGEKAPTLEPSNYVECWKDSDIIRVLWYYPKELDGTLFLVEVYLKGSSMVELRRVSTKNKNMDLPILFSDEEYEARVRVFDEHNESSNFTQPAICQPSGATAPGKVEHLSFSQINSNTALISWEKPDIFDEKRNSYVVQYSLRGSETKPFSNAKQPEEVEVAGSKTSVKITSLQPDAEYFIRVNSMDGTRPIEGPPKIISLKSVKFIEVQNDEKFIGLIIGAGIGLGFIACCIPVALFGKYLLKKYYYQRNDSLRVSSTYKKQDVKILAKNSSAFKSSVVYGNGTNLQLPLLPNGNYGNGNVPSSNIEGVRYYPGSRSIKYVNNPLMSCDSPLDEMYQTIMEVTDAERDHEGGGDSGYCDKNQSQSPPLKEFKKAKERSKNSEIPIDDGFHENELAYATASSPV